jgi:outer membrane protein assembly factor BamE (lipoprotein component of BamABCDE complex)
MQIVLERGVDDIVFGMTEAELVALLGEPDKVESDSEYGITRLYYYTSNGQVFGFFGRVRCAYL